MKSVLAFVRLTYTAAGALMTNPELKERFDFCWLYTKTDQSRLDTSIFNGHKAISYTEGGEARAEISAFMEENRVTHAIVSQPLLPYSEIVKEVCQERGIKVVWFEAFLGNNYVFDTIGCQYCERNEITEYEPTFTSLLPPSLMLGSRFPQPPAATPPWLYEKYGGPEKTMVLFAQLEHDMALVQGGGLKYQEWIVELVKSNPAVRFLVKDHPLMSSKGGTSRMVAEALLNFPNAVRFEDSVASALWAYWAFAAYSSTTIAEGAFRGIPFVTGGHHFLSGGGLSFQVRKAGDAENILGKLRVFEVSIDRLMWRLRFLTRLYTMHAWDPRVVDKVLLTADDFYEKHGINTPL